MPLARSLDVHQQSRGNLAVLTIVDSSQPEYAFQFESVFGALSHFGIPFRVVDLAREQLSDVLLAECRAVLIGQEHVGRRLGQQDLAALLGALDGGLGVVNFDNDLEGYGAEWLAAAGLAGAGRAGQLLQDGTPSLQVRDNDHPMTWYQDGPPTKQLKVPVPTVLARVAARDVRILIEDDRGAPMLVARQVGQGRLVQWLASPKVWLRQY